MEFRILFSGGPILYPLLTPSPLGASSFYINVLSCPWPLFLSLWVTIESPCVFFFIFRKTFFGTFLFLLIMISYWFRDLLREACKKCSLVPLGIFLFGFTMFVFSEAMLFLTFFWATFSSSLSPCGNVQDFIFVPDPSELTYGNTLLLSNACISLSSREFTGVSVIYFFGILSAYGFLSLQIKEFRNLGFYLNDSIYGCLFFSLTALHFSHVLLGLMCMGVFSSLCNDMNRILLIGVLVLNFSAREDFYFLVQVLYWHFVESL